MEIIGRKIERNAFEEYYKSKKSEFVVVYGRRRIGKTFLIREHFKERMSFHATGLANVSTKEQLTAFYYALKNYGLKTDNGPKNWIEAFQGLSQILEKSKEKKKVVFIDEMPWLDSPRSNFISALEHFWNGWASARTDILLIVCGSAASWMLNKVINNHGGLHNRITQKNKLEPFSLGECEDFLKHKNIEVNRYQIIELYQVFGGVPYYWEALTKGKSAAQNINSLCFSTNGLLKNEFKNLYASLFRNHENHVIIVEVLSKIKKGLTREELIQKSGLSNGGTTTKILEELEQCDFIKKYTPFNKKKRESLYQLTDFFTLFYFHFMNNKRTEENYWLSIYDSSKHRSWSGVAFEKVCYSHTAQIKRALGISGILTQICSWVSRDQQSNAQIDLLIDRKDEVINILEIKFSTHNFRIDKRYAENLRNKIGAFKQETKTKKAVSLVMLTTYPIEENQHAGMIQNKLTMEDLFFQ